MKRLGDPDEGTARFIFQAALGIAAFCSVSSLALGLQGATVGAGVFLVLDLISLAVAFFIGRIYLALRRQRWQRELARPNAALEQLFDRARAEQASAEPAGDEHERT